MQVAGWGLCPLQTVEGTWPQARFRPSIPHHTCKVWKPLGSLVLPSTPHKVQSWDGFGYRQRDYSKVWVRLAESRLLVSEHAVLGKSSNLLQNAHTTRIAPGSTVVQCGDCTRGCW